MVKACSGGEQMPGEDDRGRSEESRGWRLVEVRVKRGWNGKDVGLVLRRGGSDDSRGGESIRDKNID